MKKHENIYGSLIPFTRENTGDEEIKEETYGVGPLVTEGSLGFQGGLGVLDG